MPTTDLDLTTALIAVACIMLLAGLVHGTFGLGFPLIATPLLALMTDVRSAVVITLLPTVAVNVVSILKGGGWGSSIGRYWPMAVYVAAGSVLGSTLLVVSDPEPFRLLLAGIILLYLNNHRLSRFDFSWVVRHRQLAMLVFGLIAGVSAGAVNVMVPILIIMFMELHTSPTATVQVFNMCFLAGKLTQITVFASAGLLTGTLAAITAPMGIVAVAALLGGMALRSRISAETYRGWLTRLLWLMAAVLILQYLYGRFLGVQA